ncbi:phototropin-1-like [Arachis duranensis]|uniref:non-specific serine/threonine protein kinase n=1 Tax=Arachis duranensis TaxID=130453 RepID=A0A6P4DRA3_ARADU|nr:phototropin-1-like [Arachis duranensis]
MASSSLCRASFPLSRTLVIDDGCRACTEREILDMLDHPFLPALYASFQTKSHVCLITDYCPGGELFLLLDRQPTKVLKEEAARFYAAKVVVALEYLHCQDFDLSCLTSCKPQLLLPATDDKKKKKNKQQKGQQVPVFMAEPMRASNSFVGTEEYIALKIISGSGHTSAVDWWALGVLLYEMHFMGYPGLSLNCGGFKSDANNLFHLAAVMPAVAENRRKMHSPHPYGQRSLIRWRSVSRRFETAANWRNNRCKALFLL